MAKSKYKKGGINITAVLCAVIIAVGAVGVVTIGAGSSWFTNPDIKTWFGLNKKPAAAVLAISSDGRELTNGSICDLSRGLTYLYTTNNELTPDGMKTTEYIPDGEITLTASLSNAFINSKFDWLVSFSDGSTEWAMGKNTADFVTVTPTADGSETAKVKFIKSFNTQILITATVRGSDKSKSCTVDCLKDVNFNVSKVDIGGNDFGESVEFSIAYNYGVGTANGNYKLKRYSIELEHSFITAFKSYLKFDITVSPCYFSTEDWTGESFTSGNGQQFLVFENGLEFSYSNFIADFDSYDQAHKDAIYYAWWQAYKTNKNNVLVSFSIDYVCGEYIVSNLEETDISNMLSITGEGNGYDIQPNVNLNQNIIF